MSDLAGLTLREGASSAREARAARAGAGRDDGTVRRNRLIGWQAGADVRGEARARRLATAAIVGVTAWSFHGAVEGRGALLNARGWPLVAKFLRGALHPEHSAELLRDTVTATGVTLAYALVGTVLSLLVGLPAGVAAAVSTWTGRLSIGGPAHAARPPAAEGVRRLLWRSVRGVLAVLRGLHEAVWALLLVNVLGRDPLVAVLSIAIPYGAATAKVYAELIDETATGAYRTLRAGGAGRIGAFAYGLLPSAAGDMVSYALYRFECSLRSAVLLGMIGAGGLGFQLRQSFDGLAYGRMWTALYVLFALCFATERVSAALRRRDVRRGGEPGMAELEVRGRGRGATIRLLLPAVVLLTTVCVWWLKVSPWHLWSGKARRGLVDLARRSLPPRLPPGGARALLTASRESLQLAAVAITVAALGAFPAALLGARRAARGARVRHGRGTLAQVTAAVSAIVRAAALVARALPPTVWALLVVFVVRPGPFAGGVALGGYTFGVLTRLCGEAVENADAGPHDVLRRSGAGAVTAFAYGTLPALWPRWLAFSLYRFEVAVREAVVVGVVGAGGLGRLLARQTTSFDYASMSATLLALILLTVLVDAAGASARAAFR